jgi:hypothetical protein
MLDKLVLDLKMTLNTEITPAEGTRAIEKAVDTLSRKIPRERIYEHTWVKSITDNSFTLPAATNLEKIVKDWDISAVVAGNKATLVTKWMDVPRPVKLTLLDANDSITSFILVIKGTDINGAYQEERFYRRGGKIQTGKIYFYTITEIEMSAITGNGAGDVIDVGTDAGTGIWVALDHPVEPESESIYSALLKAGTKYTRDTDYEMDYANGKIRAISGSTMTEGTTYYANYTKAQCSIDISDIIPELIRIVKVIYPVNKIPEQAVAFTVWDNLLTVGSPRPGVSQEALVDKEHLAIFYEARQSPPTLVGSGSYPELLDEVVLIGAGGYALEMEALQHELMATTDLASLRTELSYIGGADGVSGVQALIITALAKAAVLVTASTGKVETALAKVSVALTTPAAGADDSAFSALAKISDRVADGWTKIQVALDATATTLGKVSTTDLDAATVGAVAWLLEGELLINKLNDGGESVATVYADYARSKMQIAQTRIQQAQGYAQEVQSRLSDVSALVAEAGGWSSIADGFIAEAQTLIGLVNAIVSEAQTRLGQIDRYISEATLYQQAADTDLVLSDRYRAEAQARLSRFNAILDNRAEWRKRVVSVSVRQPA